MSIGGKSAKDVAEFAGIRGATPPKRPNDTAVALFCNTSTASELEPAHAHTTLETTALHGL